MFDLKGKKRKKEIIQLVNELSELPSSDKDNIMMFLDNGEWGDALDTLCNQLYENEITISNSVYSQIEDIGKKMDMDSSSWDYLKELVK